MAALGLESLEEQESFHFFQSQSAAALSGFFDASFWQCQLLQASHSLPAVRHAVIAIGAMHRKFVVGRLPVVPDDTSDKNLRFSLQQSNRAIQQIIQSSTRRSIDDKISVMTCCVLFYCLACMQGHQGVAIEHLRSGLKILREIDEEMAIGYVDSGNHPISLHTLRIIFVNMDIQVRGIMSDEALSKWEPQPKRDFTVSRSVFTNFDQARYYLEATFADVLGFVHEVDHRAPWPEDGLRSVESEYHRLSNQFEAGSLLLEGFLSDPGVCTSNEDKDTVTALWLMHHQIKIVLKAFKRFCLEKDVREIRWDLEELDLSLLLDLVTRLLKAQPDLTLPPGMVPEDYYPYPADRTKTSGVTVPQAALPFFTAGTGIVTALWLVTSRSRDPVLRRRAIALLLDYPRREGVWDSVLAGRIAWEAVILEERTPPCEAAVGNDTFAKYPGQQYVNEQHTIRDIAIEYTGLRVAKVEFRSVTQFEKNEPGVYKHIAW
jgi:hypothetical protein